MTLRIDSVRNGYIMRSEGEQGVFESSDALLAAIERWLLDPSDFDNAVDRGVRSRRNRVDRERSPLAAGYMVEEPATPYPEPYVGESMASTSVGSGALRAEAYSESPMDTGPL